MTYVISDIHGCYDKYIKMLEKINLSAEDTLYILGDVIDRGKDGFKIMLDMAQRPNVIGLMGNHEAMAIEALSHLLCNEQQEDDALSDEAIDDIDLWFGNGGEISLHEFLGLNKEQMQTVWSYMNNMPLYKEITVDERQFVLVHGGLRGFDENRPLNDYNQHELLWHRPNADTVYYTDKCTIFGHTPVQRLEQNQNKSAEIYHGKTFIDIDCGCVFKNGRLACLCLDTMDEYYV